MAWTSWKGLLASGAIVGGLAVLAGGCSSSSGSATPLGGDASADASHGVVHRDASFETGAGDDAGEGGSTAVPPFDGTSGQPCASSANCKGSGPDAPGTNVCSNTYNGLFNTLNGVSRPQFWPTPLCMVPLPTVAGVGNCDPGPPGFLQFCDGPDPTDPASPGICLPNTIPQQAGPMNGSCLPGCSFAFDGSAPTGCPGKDTCVPFSYLFDGTAVTGHGFCQGTCQTDADCSAVGAGWSCQTDLGFCTQTKKARSKPVGTACTNAGNGAVPLATSDEQTGSCFCPFSGTTITAFYCTSSCVVGGTPCPNGWTCDAFEPPQLTFTDQTGAQTVLPGPTVQNVGLAGTCVAPCAGADAGSNDSGSLQCPALSACTAPTDMNGTVAGPDCQPM